MVEWLAGNRIRGTSAEKPTLGVSGVGGWKELARTTLDSAADTITVSSLPDKRYYTVLTNIIGSGSTWCDARLNSDTGSNYALRKSLNGASDTTSINQSSFLIPPNTFTSSYFMTAYISNLASKEKLGIENCVDGSTAGAGTAPERYEGVAKWTNTADSISSFSRRNDYTGSFDTGSEIVVLGWDPDDTHTTNFWEELVDTSWSSGSSVETSAFATKKYLWYQGWFKTGGSMSGSYSALQVGSGGTISTSGYTERYSINGAGDATEINKSNMYGLVGQGNDGSGNELTYINGFIINNSANEKLLISDAVGFNPTTGSGTGSEPNRTQGVGKWVTTGSQINKMKILSAAGSGAWVGGQLKVWGSD